MMWMMWIELRERTLNRRQGAPLEKDPLLRYRKTPPLRAD